MTQNLQTTINDWLAIIKRAKSRRTYITYKSSASLFLAASGLTVNTPIERLSEKHYEKFIERLKSKSARTEKQHATILALFFEYLSAKKIRAINMDEIRFIRRNETRKVPRRLRQIDFPAVERVVKKVAELDPKRNVITARAKALVLTMAGSGLRASEVISLKQSSLDRRKLHGVVIGKGNKEALFILDRNMLRAIDDYHRLANVDTEWLFVSHSKRDGKITRPIETDTARRDVERVCNLLLDDAPKFNITPHQLRHYFVTMIWRKTGDIKQAQIAARHDNLDTTNRYVHDDEADLNKIAEKIKSNLH